MSKFTDALTCFFQSHVFDPPDMQFRDESGVVRWPCSRCGKMFEAECGLDILTHGTCTGRWGMRHKLKSCKEVEDER